jgi:hypothetical protein
MDYPLLWKQVNIENGTFFYGKDNQSVKILIQNTDLPISKYSDELVTQIMARGAMKIYPVPENITLSGYPAMSLEGVWPAFDNPYDKTMSVRDNWIIHNGTAYRITFYSPLEVREEYQPIIAHMLHTFKIIK